MKESNGKIHITWYQAMATILVLGEFVSLCGCGKSIDKGTSTSLKTILESHADDTQIDDVLSDGSSHIYIDEDSMSDDLISYYDLACELDRIISNKNYINRIFELDKINKEEVPELSDAEKKMLLEDEEAMSTVLIDAYKRKLLSDKEKGLFYRKIKALEEYYEMWIDKNGLMISESVLKDSIKVASCEAIGIKPNIANSMVSIKDDAEFGTHVTFSTMIEKGEVTSHREYYDIPYEKNQLGVKALDEIIEAAEANDKTPFEKKYDLCSQANGNLKKLIKNGAKVKRKTLVYRG